MREDRDVRILTRIVFTRAKRPSSHRRDTQHPKEPGIHTYRIDLLRIAHARQVHVSEFNRRELFERAHHVAGVPEIAVRPRRPIDSALGKRHPHLHQPASVGKHQRLQQHRVDHGEDGRVRADPQGQRDDRHGDQARDATERSQAVPKIL
jgi:hypothetical protein